MAKSLKNNLFYLGILIISVTLFVEQFFMISNNITCFLKGLACGIELVGAVVLIKNRRNSV